MARQSEVIGLDEALKTLKQIPVAIEAELNRCALNKAAEIMKNEAEAKAPEDKGELKGSFKISKRKRKGYLRLNVITKAKHGVFQEYGYQLTSKAGGVIKKMPENPSGGFMRSTWDKHSGRAMKEFEKELVSVVKKFETKGT